MDKDREKRCEQCGKIFETPCGDWAYKKDRKHGVYWFCTWSCLRKWEREHKREITKIERRERIIQALTDGLSVKEVSVLLDEDPSKVLYWKQRMVRENV